MAADYRADARDVLCHVLGATVGQDAEARHDGRAIRDGKDPGKKGSVDMCRVGCSQEGIPPVGRLCPSSPTPTSTGWTFCDFRAATP